MSTEQEIAQALLAEVEKRGLITQFWDASLHLLPARLAAANHDLLISLHRHHDAVIQELENRRKTDEALRRG